MNDSTINTQRRDFIVRTVPACAATCLALKGAAVAASAGQPQGQAQGQAAATPKHKFDSEYPAKLTYRQMFQLRYGATFIPLIEVMKKSLGQEKTIAMLTQMTEQGAAAQAQTVAKQSGNDLAALKKVYGNPQLANIWTPEVVRDTESIYELRVTECLWASTFRQANLAEEGHAVVCLADFALVKALNPKIELKRDKTLMQGHDYCNHCYTVKG